jgi:hypothetical protein
MVKQGNAPEPGVALLRLSSLNLVRVVLGNPFVLICGNLRLPVAAVIAAAFSIASLAQSSAQPAWTSTTTTKVKPEMRAQFEGYLKQVMAAYKKGGTPWFLTLQTFAGDTTEYTTIVPVMKFADLDGPPVPAGVLGQKGWESLSSKIARCYSAQTRQYATPLTALEINRTDAPIGLYWVETRSQAVQEKMDDYLDWLKDEYRPALEKAGVAGFRVSIVVFGSAGGEIVSMRMLKDLAEIDGGSILTRALGSDGARTVSAKGAKLVLATSTRILRVRTDLTYSPSN